MELSQAFQDLCNMLVMFGHTSGVDEDIINVDEQKLMEELPEHLMHEILEYGGSADQSIKAAWRDIHSGQKGSQKLSSTRPPHVSRCVYRHCRGLSC